MNESAGLLIIVGIATTVFWMVVAWRAMIAHERLADATRTIAEHGRNRGDVA